MNNYMYFLFYTHFSSLQTEPKLLPQVEEVTYAEPVLLPQPPNPNKIHQPPMGSPKSTLRKPMMGHHHPGVNSEALFQVKILRIKFST
jgi:semaphorin 6